MRDNSVRQHHESLLLKAHRLTVLFQSSTHQQPTESSVGGFWQDVLENADLQLSRIGRTFRTS